MLVFAATTAWNGQLDGDWGAGHPDLPRVRGDSNYPRRLAALLRWEESETPPPHPSSPPHLLPPWRLHLANPRCNIKYREIISVISMEICFQIISPCPYILALPLTIYLFSISIIASSSQAILHKRKTKVADLQYKVLQVGLYCVTFSYALIRPLKQKTTSGQGTATLGDPWGWDRAAAAGARLSSGRPARSPT